MSASYTLHLRAGSRPGDPAALDGAEVVRDGFAWGAFLVPMLWFFSHRNWVLGLGALAVVLAVGAILAFAGVPAPAAFGVQALLHLLIGFEGASLRRWWLALRGRPAFDIVVAGSRADAEVKSFRRWIASAPGFNRPPPLPGSPAPAPGFAFGSGPGRDRSEPIIGLFPDVETRRP